MLASVGPATVSLQGVVGVVGVGTRWTESMVDAADFFTGRYGDLLWTGSLQATTSGVVDVELLPSLSLRIAADLLQARVDGFLVQAPADVAMSLGVLQAARVGLAVGF